MSDDTLRHDGGWSDRNVVVWRHSTLTDAEREVLERLAERLNDWNMDDAEYVVRGLLERLGGRE